MKKIAIFVEGMTEQEFVVFLVKELVGNRGLHVDFSFQFGGTVQITPKNPPPNTEFLVLVVDCRSDEQVKTQMREQYATLVRAGYNAIIGLRDVYPFAQHDIPRLMASLNVGLPVGPVAPKLHLAIMEVEAWFIGEETHFGGINKLLTPQFIVNSGFDVIGVSANNWPNPAKTLDDIYRLSGSAYTTGGKKNKRRVLRTLRAMDFNRFYSEVRGRLSDLDAFIEDVESSLFN